MSGSQNLFSAQSATIAVAATATASVAALLPFACGTLRIVNEGPNMAFVAVAATAVGAVATLPAGAAAQTCTPVLPASDITLSIAGATAQYISAICRAAGTAVLSVSTGEGV